MRKSTSFPCKIAVNYPSTVYANSYYRNTLFFKLNYFIWYESGSLFSVMVEGEGGKGEMKDEIGDITSEK